MSPSYRHSKSLRLLLNASGWQGSLGPSQDTFRVPGEVVELLAQIAQGAQDLQSSTEAALEDSLAAWRGCDPQALVAELLAAGLLVGGAPEDAGGFGDSWIQWTMVADRPRTEAYFHAIDQVAPGSRAVDLGAGTGVFSSRLLGRGAQVTAIEQAHGPCLKALGREHTSSGSLEIFWGSSLDWEPQGRTDVVVSELFGNDPFEEGVLPTLRDMAAKCPGATFVPGGLSVYVQPAEILPGSEIHSRLALFHQCAAGKGRDSYLDSIRSHLPWPSLSVAAPLRPEDVAPLGPPARLCEVPLNPPPPGPVVFTQAVVPWQDPGAAGALLVWFRVHVGRGATVSSSPLEGDRSEHWRPLVLPFLSAPGEVLHVSASLDEDETSLRVTARSGGKLVAAR